MDSFYSPFPVPDLGWRNGMRLDEVFAVDSSVFKRVKELLGEKNALLAQRFWERENDFPYGYGIRYPIPVTQTFRTRRFGALKYSNAVNNLSLFLRLIQNKTLPMDELTENPAALPSAPAGKDD